MAELVDYRVSYGECIGYCTSVLTIDGFDMELVQIGNGPDSDERRFTGEIDTGFSRSILEEVAHLEQGNLNTVYGTPDARDEGAVTVRIRGQADITEHRYSRGEPPKEFAALDALLSPILLGWIDGDSVAGLRFDDSP